MSSNLGKSANDGNYNFNSLEAFMERADQIKDLLLAKRAVATIHHFENYMKDLGDQKIEKIGVEETHTKIAEYARSNQSLLFNFPPINEVAIVLLCAYFESFIEDLHEEAVKNLVHGESKSSGVLDALIHHAHDQFRNPNSYSITVLFDTCCIDKITTKLSKFDPKITKRSIDEFVRLRNEIAHGERRSVSYLELDRWVNFTLQLARTLFEAVTKEVIAQNQKL